VYVVTSYLISEAIRTSLYAPIATYETLSLSLADALSGNFSRILSNPAVMIRDARPDVCVEPASTIQPSVYTHQEEAAIGIVCGDSQATSVTRDFRWAESIVAMTINQSATVGEPWTRLPLACTGWQFTPPYAFAGPFGSPAPDNTTNTPAAPLLFLSTRTDHATPLVNAFAMSALHGGSAVVVQESVGHCALLSSVSQCTYGIVKEYFRSGTVPANGTVCEAECVPAIPYKACPGLPGA
jgi:autophagy-related protein 17